MENGYLHSLELQTNVTSNVKRQKVLTFAKKKNEKRVVSFFGFIAKLQQALHNKNPYFVYYANKKIIAYLTLLRDNGFVQNFYTVPKIVQTTVLKLKLSPDFQERLLVVYLKPANKLGKALNSIQLYTIPSRSIFIRYDKLSEKVMKTGASTMYVLNTSKGLLSHTTALQYKIGGELLCKIN